MKARGLPILPDMAPDRGGRSFSGLTVRRLTVRRLAGIRVSPVRRQWT